MRIRTILRRRLRFGTLEDGHVGHQGVTMCIRGRGKDIERGVVDLDVTPSASYPGRWSTSRSCVTRGIVDFWDRWYWGDSR